MGNQLIPQEEFQTYTSLAGTTVGSQTESPSDSGILTTRTLDITSISNNDLDSSYNLGDTSVITDYNTLLVYINELLIRFDASPKYYQKEDYKHLIKTIVDSLRYLYTDSANINLDIETIFQHLNSYADSVTQVLSYKVDKVEGKGLSTEDYTTAEKSKVANVPLNTNTELAAKVDKVDGKSLVDDTEINKLAEYPEFEDLGYSHENLTDKNSESAFQHITLSEKSILKNSLTSTVYLPSLPIQGGMSKLIYYNNEIYLAARNNTNKMYKYNLVTRDWIELANSPATLQTSGGTCFDGSRYIYTLRGGNTITNNFYRYDIITNTWSTIGSTQFSISNIHIGTGDGSRTVFGLWGGKSFPASSNSRAANVNLFVNGILTPATININTLTATFTTAPVAGSVITASFILRQPMGSSGAITIFNDEIYVVFGDDTPVFGKYNISLNNWTVLQDTPGYCDWSGMLDEVVHIGGQPYIYVLRGENDINVDTPDFWRYNINSNSWEVMTSTPLATDSSDLMLCGEYILALRGVNSLHQFLYSIKNNSWIQITNAPFTTLRGSVVKYGQYDIGTSSKFDYIINDGIQGFLQINRVIIN